MTRIFVYGTLKKGNSAHYLLNRSAFIGPARTTARYAVFDMGGFPGMLDENEGPGGVDGEVFDCDEETLRRLDEYEGVERGLFERDEIELADGSTAEAYLFLGCGQLSIRHRDVKIESGRWDEP